MKSLYLAPLAAFAVVAAPAMAGTPAKTTPASANASPAATAAQSKHKKMVTHHRRVAAAKPKTAKKAG